MTKISGLKEHLWSFDITNAIIDQKDQKNPSAKFTLQPNSREKE